MAAENFQSIVLRRFSKFVCAATLFLIFAGGMVKSTESGLAVPDWPLSYGSFFPPMVGGVFYEHGHRMVASAVGLLTVGLAVFLTLWEKRRWVKMAGWTAVVMVITQGILGGITVLFFLPDAISIAHGLLAQTFFLVTIFIAYSQSVERKQRENNSMNIQPNFLKMCVLFIIIIYGQLFLGALMRHTESGLAVPWNYWWPNFNENVMLGINWRLMHNNLDLVTQNQAWIHFSHRLGALAVMLAAVVLTVFGVSQYKNKPKILNSIFLLDLLIASQIALGILTVYSLKLPSITTFHVTVGAAVLGMSVLLLLRAAPIQWGNFTKNFLTR